MQEYQEEFFRKKEANKIEDEHSTHVLYNAHINTMQNKPEVAYLAPLGTAVNKFVKMVQDHTVAGYETANWVKNRMYKRSGNSNNAKHLRAHPGCFVIVVNDKVVLAIDIKTQKTVYSLNQKEWFN